jgi:hypothetical protein
MCSAQAHVRFTPNSDIDCGLLIDFEDMTEVNPAGAMRVVCSWWGDEAQLRCNGFYFIGRSRISATRPSRFLTTTSGRGAALAAARRLSAFVA